MHASPVRISENPSDRKAQGLGAFGKTVARAPTWEAASNPVPGHLRAGKEKGVPVVGTPFFGGGSRRPKRRLRTLSEGAFSQAEAHEQCPHQEPHTQSGGAGRFTITTGRIRCISPVCVVVVG